MSLATICARLALRVGVQPATTWAGNPDVTAAEVVEWVNEGQALVSRAHDWQALLRDGTAALPATIADPVELPADLGRLIPDSLWLTGTTSRLRGPLPPAEWAQVQQQTTPGFTPCFTMAGAQLLVATTDPAGGPLAFRYVVAVPDFTNDADVSPLGESGERLVLLAATAAYRDAKGLPAQSAEALYLQALAQAKALDTPVGALSLRRRPFMPRNGVAVVFGGSYLLGGDEALLTGADGAPLIGG